jgi:orotate phosphoribosyltransferase
MKDYQKTFIQLAIESKSLSFGEFKLKSGRVSPYFFNSGTIFSGKNISRLGKCYAAAITESGLTFDMMFGPAYKGIGLAHATAIALVEQHGIDIPIAYNRKEIKDHGESGRLVGAPLSGDVLIIDDVITAGTAIRESIDIIEENRAITKGIIIALDRQERGVSSTLSATEEIKSAYKIEVKSIINLDDLVEYFSGLGGDTGHKIKNYREQYGVS